MRWLQQVRLIKPSQQRADKTDWRRADRQTALCSRRDSERSRLFFTRRAGTARHVRTRESICHCLEQLAGSRKLTSFCKSSSCLAGLTALPIQLLRLAGESQLDEIDVRAVSGLRRLVVDSISRRVCLVYADKAALYEVADGCLRGCGEATMSGIEDVVFDDGETTILAATRTREGVCILQQLHFQQEARNRTSVTSDLNYEAAPAFVSASSRNGTAVTRVKELPDGLVLLGFSEARFKSGAIKLLLTRPAGAQATEESPRLPFQMQHTIRSTRSRGRSSTVQSP